MKCHPSHNHLRDDQEIIVILFDRESFDQEIASLQLSNTKFMPETAKEEIYIYFTTIGKTACSTQHMLYSDYFYRLRKDDDMIIYLVIHDFSNNVISHCSIFPLLRLQAILYLIFHNDFMKKNTIKL